MAKRKASKKKAAVRRSTKKVSGRRALTETVATRKKKAVPTSIEDWLRSIQGSHAAAEAAAKPKGACLVGDPAGGPSMCFFVDRDTCKVMKGTFLGGPC